MKAPRVHAPSVVSDGSALGAAQCADADAESGSMLCPRCGGREEHQAPLALDEPLYDNCSEKP
jgi:hypothetical protein